jgi:hypothetical protein
MNFNLSSSSNRNSIIPGQYNQFGQDFNAVRTTNYLSSWVSPQKSPLRGQGQQNIIYQTQPQNTLRSSSQPPLRTTYLPPSPIHVNPIHFPLTQGIVISQPNFDRETIMMDFGSKSPLRNTEDSSGGERMCIFLHLIFDFCVYVVIYIIPSGFITTTFLKKEETYRNLFYLKE